MVWERGPHKIDHARVVHLGLFRQGNGSAMSQKVANAQQSPLFSAIPLTDLERILSRARENTYLPEETIFMEGDLVREVGVITLGQVKKTQLSHNGFEVILRVCGPGEVVRTSAGRRHGSTAQAMQLTTMLVWESVVFEALLAQFSTLGYNMAQITSQCLLKLEERFCEISTEKVAVRLRKEIIRLMRQVGPSQDGSFEIKLSREELAQLTGTTVFTVSRLLSLWERQGIVHTQTQYRSLKISNFQILENLGKAD
jgi:CRP-like cAMP-binding protein